MTCLFIQAQAGIVEMLFNSVWVHHEASPVRQAVKGEVGEFPGDGAGLLGAVKEDEKRLGWCI